MPKPASVFYDGVRANAGIDADYQADAFRSGAVDNLRPHAVTIPHSVRHEKLRGRSCEIESLLQNDDGRRAVYVVVPIEKDLFLTRDGFSKTCCCPIHIPEQKGIVHVFESGLKKALHI